MKDIFKKVGLKFIGPRGIKCSCCDNKLGNKRNSKIGKNLYNRMRRSVLKQKLYKESIEGELEAIDDNILIK